MIYFFAPVTITFFLMIVFFGAGTGSTSSASSSSTSSSSCADAAEEDAADAADAAEDAAGAAGAFDGITAARTDGFLKTASSSICASSSSTGADASPLKAKSPMRSGSL